MVKVVNIKVVCFGAVTKAHPTAFLAQSISSPRPKAIDSIAGPANNLQRHRLTLNNGARGIRALKTRALEIRKKFQMFLAGLVAENKTRWWLMSIKTPDPKP